GTSNGETAAHLDDAAYGEHLYISAVGREAEPGGQAYWTEHLESGGAGSEFIALLLASALQSEGDDTYLGSRIAVAKYAAQDHISSDPESIGLAFVLDGVHNHATAWSAIKDIDHGVFDLTPGDAPWDGSLPV